MDTRFIPRIALRLGTGFAAALLMLAAALGLGFKAGAGFEWARHAVFALGMAALLAGVLVAWCVARAVARSARDARLVSRRLDRVLNTQASSLAPRCRYKVTAMPRRPAAKQGPLP